MLKTANAPAPRPQLPPEDGFGRLRFEAFLPAFAPMSWTMRPYLRRGMPMHQDRGGKTIVGRFACNIRVL
jgi:hypothetical protein